MIIKMPRFWVFALIDFVLTALAWVIFLYLFGGGVASILKGDMPGIAVPLASRLLPFLYTLLVYIVIAIGIGLVLFAWAKYNEIRFGRFDRRKTPGPVSNGKLASRFGITDAPLAVLRHNRSEEHTSELQSLMRLSYAFLCLKKIIRHN